MLPDCPDVLHLRQELMSKFVSKETASPELRRSRAIAKWLETESRNEETNLRLLTTHEEYNILPRVTFDSFLHSCRRIVHDVLGDTIPLDTLIGDFSGGATTSRKRTESHPASKYFGEADITSAALPWFELALESMVGWNNDRELLSIREISGNVLFVVPKNADIDRVACKEPDLNMFLQKGVGNYIRRNLRRFGINLNDQTRNQSLAREGSLNGNLATLDLSSASDSISFALVELLLPDLWFSFLNGLRSPITMIDGVEHCNEMFSSMGNGFTFELESLLFYAIARATAYHTRTSGIISVYGDDIVCPVDLAQDLSWVLGYLGFSLNESKSFWSGPFRESCGGHYYNGADITPFYIRGPVRKLTDLIQLLNAIRRWSDRDSIGILDTRLEPLWLLLSEYVPRCLWGGYDTNMITQLVSTGLPSRRLMPINPKPVLNGLGGYVLWLNTTWDRDALGEGVVTSTRRETGTRYRTRPIVSHNDFLSRSEFLTELCGAKL